MLRRATAWELIRWDDGIIRIQGGRALYEAVMYNCVNEGRMVKLARLDAVGNGLRELSRYVEPDTIIEIMEEVAAEPKPSNGAGEK